MRIPAFPAPGTMIPRCRCGPDDSPAIAPHFKRSRLDRHRAFRAVPEMLSGGSLEPYDDFEAMPASVRLRDILDALEVQFDEYSSFLDLETGQVETVSNALLHDAEESGDDEEPVLSSWQKQEWETVKQIVSTNRFVKLPTKFEVHEWAIMQEFAHSVDSQAIRKQLLNAIHGAGAFRMFKETLRRHGIESSWFAFRSDALRQIATDWCQKQHITWH
jgi:hypothetical protein